MKAFSFLFFSLALLSCERASYITLSLSRVECDRPGLTDTLLVRSDGDWQVGSTPLWIDAQKLSDTTLLLSVGENRTRRTREAELVLSAGKVRETLHVVERGVARFVVVDSTTMVFRPEGEERDLKVGTDGCFMHVSVPPYIKYYRQGENVHLVVRANRTGDREGTIIITVDSLQRRIRYSQEILPHLREKVVEQVATEPATPVPSAPRVEATRGNCRRCGGTGSVMDEYGMGELTCEDCGGTGSYR